MVATDRAWAWGVRLIANSGAGPGAVRIRSTVHDDPDPDEPARVHRHRPDQHFSENGVVRFYARVGVPQLRQSPDGSTTELEPTFHDLVIFRKTAERPAKPFRTGDTFVASGHVNEYPYERHGCRVVPEEFVARHIGHDFV